MNLPFSKPVTLIRNPGAPTEQRIQTKAYIEADRGIFLKETPIYEGDLVETSDPRGGVRSLRVARVFICEVGSSLDHIEVAFDSRPAAVASRGGGNVIQNFNGPVGAIQTGEGAVANISQTFGISDEVGTLIEHILRSSSQLRADAAQELQDQINDLKAELATSSPRPSRLRAYLSVMVKVTTGIVDIAPKIIELAERLHIRLT